MRVVAVSAETSLAAALNMMDGWEVVFAREGEDVGEVAAGAAVVLAGGGTTHGLELVADLRAKGMNIPAVVLGDSPAPEDAGSTVLSPPFTLDELRAAVESAVRSGRRALEDATAQAAAAAVAAEAATAETEARARAEAQAKADAAAAEAAQAKAARAAPAPRTEPQPVEPPRVEPSRSADAAFSPVDPSTRSEGESAARIEDADAASTPARTVFEGNGAIGAAPVVSTSQAEVPIQRLESPPVAPALPSAPSVPAEGDDPAGADVQPSRPVPAAPAEDRGKRRKRRRDRDEEVPASPSAHPPLVAGSVDARLRLAEQAARAIEDVLRDMPFLSDLESLSEAVVGEIVAAFSPGIVALYLPAGDGYWVAGGYQLTPAEKRLNVKPDHPLFRELLATGEPMLIAPLDLARAMVSGIAGARTEAMIAGPVQGSAGCVGVIIVGRDDFEDKDLDVLAGLAAEAASGLAVGQAIDRLRSRRR